MRKLGPVEVRTLNLIRAWISRNREFTVADVQKKLGTSRRSNYYRVHRLADEGWFDRSFLVNGLAKQRCPAAKKLAKVVNAVIAEGGVPYTDVVAARMGRTAASIHKVYRVALRRGLVDVPQWCLPPSLDKAAAEAASPDTSTIVRRRNAYEIPQAKYHGSAGL